MSSNVQNSKKQSCPQLKESAILVGTGVIYQEKGNYEMSQLKMQSGIEKLKELLVSDTQIDRQMILNYYSLFEKFLSYSTTEKENEKNDSEFIKEWLLGNENQNQEKIETFSDNLDKYKMLKMSDSTNMINFTNEIMAFFAKAFDEGFYFTKNIFLRKEIFSQLNAKIDSLDAKYETFKFVSSKIDDLLILAKQNAIKYENIVKFCSLLSEIQNNCSSLFKIANPSKYSDIKNIPYSFSFMKKLSDIKNNLLKPKLNSKPDYFSVLSNLCKHFKDFNLIFAAQSFEKKNLTKLEDKKKEICSFFQETIIKWNFNDIRELTLRFLKKKILLFELTEPDY